MATLPDKIGEQTERQRRRSSGNGGAAGTALVELVPDFAAPSSAFELVGLATFAVTAVATIGVLSLSLFSLPGDSNYSVLRTSQIFLTLCGTSLILVFLARNRSFLAITLSILLVGALIVPSNDLIRFLLIVSGSDKKFSDYYIGDGNLTNRFDRTTEIVTRLLDRLDFNGYVISPKGGGNRETQPGAEVNNRTNVVRIMSDTVAEQLNRQIMESLRQRGADQLLMAVHLKQCNPPVSAAL